MRRKRNNLGWIVAAVAATALFAPPAAAAPEAALVTRDVVLAGPVLAGDRVAWTAAAGRNAVAVRAAELDGFDASPQTVTTFDGGDLRVSGSLAASPEALAVQDFRWSAMPDGRLEKSRRNRVLASPWGQPLAPIGRPSLDSGATPMAVGGTRVAYVSYDDLDAATLAVRDLAGGAPVDIPVTAFAAYRVAFAGDLFVWSQTQDERGFSATSIYATDLRTNERRLLWSGGLQPDKWAVRADGALALTEGSSDGLHLLRFVDPTGTVHDLPDASDQAVRFAGDRIAFVRRATDDYSAERTIALVDPESGAVRDLARFAGWPPTLTGWDVDAERLVWTEWQCDGSSATWSIRLDAVEQEPVAAHPVAACRPTGLESRRLTVDRRGNLQARLYCPRGCYGRLQVGWRRDPATARTGFDLPASTEPQTLRLRFPADDVPRRVRRGKPLRVRGTLMLAGPSTPFQRTYLRLRLVPASDTTADVAS